MDSQDALEDRGNYQGFSPTAYGAPSMPPVPPPGETQGASFAVSSLRPLSTGEVLDRTFTLYRQRFWLFAGIGMLPAGTVLVTSSIRLLFVTLTHRTDLLQPSLTRSKPTGLPGAAMGSLLALQLYLLPAAVLFLVGYALSHAATVDAVNRIGQRMAVSAWGAYGAVRGRWLRWCGIVMRQFWSAMWPLLPGTVLLFGALGAIALPGGKKNMLLAGGVMMLAVAAVTAGAVFGVINFVRNTLAIAAGVSENTGVNVSMRRSRTLSHGRKGRLFLAWLLVYALQMVVAAVQAPLLFTSMSLRGGAFIAVQAVAMLVQFVVVALVAPVASIAFTLFYLDERVRREGFDIELLMRRTLPQTATPYALEA